MRVFFVLDGIDLRKGFDGLANISSCSSTGGATA
jgi:hypothetical protein